jgi:hypothetical protein
MRRALARSRDDRYPDAAAMQVDLERYLKSAVDLATAAELGAYLRRELPPSDEDEETPGTAQQAQGTQGQSQGTQKQEHATEAQAPADTERQSLPPIPESMDTGDSEEETAERDGPTNVRRTLPDDRRKSGPAEGTGPENFDRPYSGTSLVPPLPQHPNRRAYVAAAVAAFTVAGVGLLVLRPWKSQAQGPIIVVEPPPRAPVVRELAPPPPVETPPAPPAIDIVSRPPGARVTIDSRRVEGATPIRAHALTPGPHDISVEHTGFQPRQISLLVQPGEHRTLEVELHPVAVRRGRAATRPTGTLTVRTVPWSKVYDGARLLGTTPLANVPLSAGSHTLRFVNPDLPPQKRSVTVTAGDETRLSLELTK